MKIFNREFLKKIWKVLIATFNGFIADNGLKLSASLAYYTVFSLAPLLILVVSIVSLVFGHDAFSNKVYPELVSFVGDGAAKQIQDVIIKLSLSGKSGIAVVAGAITLVIGATSMFLEIQDSLNIIWRVKAKPKRGWVKMLQNRFLSFSLIISLGFLLLVSLILNLLVLAISNRLEHFLPVLTVWVFNGINMALAFIVISTLFAIIFKFLPDAEIKWKDVRSGAIFTAILFMIGKYLIGLYIEFTAQGSAYGAAGSIIIILVWIYYTAAILFIGAEFTQVYAEASGSVIQPAEYAVHVQQTEIEHVVKKLPAQNPELKGELKKDLE
ncbi:YihY/virulence factor BrkB family protein [Mucilaginibacter mali]|uniref:YihY/virulence factor BrkB family protein n=1 Tax=Mucilaginibacter mali TaxID=2740462 RepID=A0A7D4TZ01_9SPHI|nr:YihY/virulence factor BrkB family protein [Mucilaginibacter mali]QKJ31757.1 YihY/virulence factor BrkB family protein [Mucilaginibacter mali]